MIAGVSVLGCAIAMVAVGGCAQERQGCAVYGRLPIRTCNRWPYPFMSTVMHVVLPMKASLSTKIDSMFRTMSFLGSFA